jgi:hypothetical protein
MVGSILEARLTKLYNTIQWRLSRQRNECATNSCYRQCPSETMAVFQSTYERGLEQCRNEGQEQPLAQLDM